MASAQSLIGLFGAALVLARLAAATGRKDERRRRWLAGITFALAWVPLGTLSLAGYVRGVTGDLSVTTMVLVVVSLVGHASSADRRAVSVTVVAGAIFLYPMALGVGGLDPYRLGYGPNVLLAVVFLGAVAAWLRQRYLVLTCLLLAVTAHALDLMESSNLWDYLLDPWVALASIYDLRRVRRKA